MSDESYIVSARKYRPATFHTVVGQKALTSTLKNAILTGRMAQAYLFCGPRGVGKTSCARIFARTINCLNRTPDGEACGECESCRSIDAGNSFNIIELDAASNNSVDDIRTLTEQVTVPPQVGTHRVFIIDEVHMLTSAAFNAFLKTLEEPPAYVVFILATTEKHKVIPTILSRCQIYDFKRITIADMVEHLRYVAEQEGIRTQDSALNVIAQKADGAMRDALSIFDQVTASSRGNITYESAIENLNILDYDYYFRLIDAFLAADVQQSLLIYKEIRDKGFDSLFFIGGLASHVRDILVASDARTVPLLEVGDEIGRHYLEQAQRVPLRWSYEALKILNDCDLNYRTAGNKQLLVELALIRLCTLIGEDARPAPARVPLPVLNVTPGATSPAQTTPASTPAPTTPASPTTPPATQAPSPSASEPAAPVVAAPRVTAPKATRKTSFRLRSDSQELEPQTQTPSAAEAAVAPTALPTQAPASSQTAEIAVEDVTKAWDAFIAANPDKHILISAMEICRPYRRDAAEYGVKVTTPIQVEQFDANLDAILTHIRNAVRNSAFTLRVELTNEAPAVDLRLLTPQDFIAKATAKNPVLADLLNGINAEII